MKLKSRYQLIALFSSNSFSKTFFAIDELSEVTQKCAIKQFKPTSITGINLDAIKLALPIEFFPQILDIFTEEGKLYIVNEYIHGLNLKQVLDSEGVFNESQIWRLLNELLTALNALHLSNIIHRNIKPTSIIKVKREENPSIYLYRLLSPDLPDAIALNLPSLSNPEYSPPEQLAGKTVFASDLYSLGVTCIYLLTGVRLFELFDSSNNCWIWQDYLPEKISADLERAIAKLIHNDIVQRFNSVAEVLKAINTDPLAYLVAKETNRNTNQAGQWDCVEIDLTKSGFGSINSIAIDQSENIVAAGRDNKNIELWNLKSKSLLSTLTGHSSAVRSVTFSANGQKLVSASDDKTVRIWDVEKEKIIAILTGHTNSVRSVTYSPCYQFIATGSWDKTVKLWDSHSFSEICTISGHKLQVNTVAFSPDGKLLASGSCDRTINIWDVSSSNSPELVSTLKGHLWAILAIAFHPNEPIIASGSDDNTIKIWDYKHSRLINTISGHSKSVSSLKFIGMGETLVSGGWDNQIKFWHVDSGDEIASISSRSRAIYSLTITKDNQTIISSGKDENIKLWQYLKSK